MPDIKFPDKRFSVDADLLQNEVNRLADTPQKLPDSPITCSLLHSPVTGVVGESEGARVFLQSLFYRSPRCMAMTRLKSRFL